LKLKSQSTPMDTAGTGVRPELERSVGTERDAELPRAASGDPGATNDVAESGPTASQRQDITDEGILFSRMSISLTRTLPFSRLD